MGKYNWSEGGKMVGNKQVTSEGFASLFIREEGHRGLKSTSKPGFFYILSGEIQFPLICLSVLSSLQGLQEEPLTF